MQQKLTAIHCSNISELSTTDTRVIETHAKPRESIRQRRSSPLFTRSMHTGVNNGGNQHATETTYKELQAHLRAIYY